MRLPAGALAALVAAAPLAAAELEVRAAAAAAGEYGLDVTVGSTCSAPDEVSREAPPATVGDLEACRTLNVAGVEVASAASFLAGEIVALGDGFSVADGALLTVALDPQMPQPFASVSTGAPIAERTFSARFQLRLDALFLAEGEQIEHLRALDGDGADVFRVILRRQAGQNLLVLGARQDGGGEILTPAGQEVALPAGWNLVELEWRAGPGDGQLQVAVNQAPAGELTGLANDLAQVERFSWGAVDGAFRGSPGRLEVDGFSARR